jgi:hypothetical protein
MKFAFTLFDRNGYLKSEFRRNESGTGSGWGPEVDQPILAYLDEIEIEEKERGKGIGSWALQQIWKVKDGLDVRHSFLSVLQSLCPKGENPKLTVIDIVSGGGSRGCRVPLRVSSPATYRGRSTLLERATSPPSKSSTARTQGRSRH